ncbi:Zn(II)2Cys6 transcription factor [Aspergillus ustus]|uniref:Zn(II)2Cys6 transcription factor n=1 Tax=Aspergillus ustus TaxID=40382 RepID=A0A0C1C442_ASPUT|nr:Zn(II)2Cys6 transcription factor [Aspergillus ustus]
MASVTSDLSPARPYRSHKIPACDFCRKRRSRCTQEVADQPCLLCRMHGATCSRATSAGTGTGTSTPRPIAAASPRPTPVIATKRRRISKDSSSNITITRDHQQPVPVPPPSRPSRNYSPPGERQAPTPEFTQNNHSTTVVSSGQSSRHIVGPAMARDAQVLERCMSSTTNYNTAVSYARPNPYSVYSDDTRNPVVYMKVPRQRGAVPSGNGTAGFKQFEAMEKVIEPLGHELCNIYFNNIHPPFPILDEKTVLEAYQQDGLPHTLACEIYAVSLILWKRSPTIAATRRPAPDIKYMWNLTVSAMNDDFLSPNFSTVLACILDLLGRPITSITYNAVNVGRVVALAQSLGLNRNPASWGLDRRQKSLRIRTWWGILIHDQWASLSHGTPPHIHRSQWDVPLPDSDSLLVDLAAGQGLSADSRVQGGHSFIALCSLTTILGQILPLIYALEIQPLETSFRTLRRHETTLNEWEESLPSWLRPTSPVFERKAAGALNLQLSFLAVKLCLARMALLEIHRSSEDTAEEDKLYYRSQCRKAARAVIDFTTTLCEDEIDAFWLPYTAYHFTSAATLTLRCALEAETPDTAQECVASAKSLIDFLRQTKDELNWDLADICLGQCEAVVDRLCDWNNLDTWRKNPPGQQQYSSERQQQQGSSSNSSVPFPTPADTVPSESHADVPPPLVQGALNYGQADSEHHMNPDYLQTFMTFGSMPGGGGMISDYVTFPDLWQMPNVDDYDLRTFP